MNRFFLLFLAIGTCISCKNRNESVNQTHRKSYLDNYSASKDNACNSTGERLIRFDIGDSLFGYKNGKGAVVIPADYLMVYEKEVRNYAIVMNSEHEFIGIDKHNRFLYKVYPFDNGPDYINNNRFRIVKDKKIGFANGKTGCIEVSPSFSYAEYFNEGLATFCIGGKLVKQNEHSYWSGGKWGVIDTTGQVIVSPEYTFIEQYQNGKTTAFINDKKFILDKKGMEIMK